MTTTRITEISKTFRHEEGDHDQIVERYKSQGWEPFQGIQGLLQTSLINKQLPGTIISISKASHP